MDLEFEVSVRRAKPAGEKKKINPPSVRGALPARSWQIEEIHDESLVDQAINAIRATETQGFTKPKLQVSVWATRSPLLIIRICLESMGRPWLGFLRGCHKEKSSGQATTRLVSFTRRSGMLGRFPHDLLFGTMTGISSASRRTWAWRRWSCPGNGRQYGAKGWIQHGRQQRGMSSVGSYRDPVAAR